MICVDFGLVSFSQHQKMFDLGVNGGDRSAPWRRLSISVTQVGQAKRGRYGSRPDESRCPAAAGSPGQRPVAAPGSARGGRRAGRGRLSPGLAAGPADAATRARLTARAAANRITDFGQGWKFALVNPDGITDPTGAYANAMDPGFDDSGWQQLDVPHDWSIELAPVDNASTSSATGFLPGGLAWYRKHFTLPKSLAGQQISIESHGVYRNSTCT